MTQADTMTQVPITTQAQRLVADIGGTHARFALLNERGEPEQAHHLKTADYADLGAAIAAYAARLPAFSREAKRLGDVSAVISIAAPLAGDRVKMTNAAWDFSILQTQLDLGLKRLHLINDFEALALAVPTLQTQELTAIGHALPLDRTRTKAIVGPGTGLGMAGIMPVVQGGQTTWHAMTSEGGHVSVAPACAREAALLQAAWDMGRPHLCWEDFLSGTGLPLLHRAVCTVDGLAYQERTPAQIGEAALLHADAGCLTTLHTLCAMLGGAAGDLALMMGARGGVYIKGGVLDRVLEIAPEFLQQSQFRERFCAKGDYANYLQSIPTWFITAPQIALRGCASLL